MKVLNLHWMSRGESLWTQRLVFHMPFPSLSLGCGVYPSVLWPSGTHTHTPHTGLQHSHAPWLENIIYDFKFTFNCSSKTAQELRLFSFLETKKNVVCGQKSSTQTWYFTFPLRTNLYKTNNTWIYFQCSITRRGVHNPSSSCLWLFCDFFLNLFLCLSVAETHWMFAILPPVGLPYLHSPFTH